MYGRTIPIVNLANLLDHARKKIVNIFLNLDPRHRDTPTRPEVRTSAHGDPRFCGLASPLSLKRFNWHGGWAHVSVVPVILGSWRRNPGSK